MTIRQSTVSRQFTKTHNSSFKNIFVNGCSYTWNNSQASPVTWPYYLRDLGNLDQVYDCSQGGAGSNHIFTSTINELETNSNINKDDTFIIIMWSGLSRVDVVATPDIDSVITSSPVPGYQFWRNNRFNYSENFLSLPLMRYKNQEQNGTPVDELCKNYHRLIDADGQILVSATKILALYEYLKNKGFKFLFLSWEKQAIDIELSKISSELANAVRSKIDNIKTLGEYADENNLRIKNDWHPNPDAHLKWTREHLIPHLESLNFLEKGT